MSKTAKWYHDNYNWDKPRWKKYDNDFIFHYRWINFTVYCFVTGMILFRDTFITLWYYWSFWGAIPTLVALLGITKCAGEGSDKQIYSAWVVPTAIIYEFASACNLAITIEFFIVFGPLIRYMDWHSATDIYLLVYMTLIHSVPVLTCIGNAYLSKVKLRVDDCTIITIVCLQYWIANWQGQHATGEPVYPGTPMNWDHPVLCVICLIA